MKKLVPEDSAVGASPAESRARAVGALRSRLRLRRRELQHCSHALEAALHLLWAHLHVYLRLTAHSEPYAIDPDTCEYLSM